MRYSAALRPGETAGRGEQQDGSGASEEESCSIVEDGDAGGTLTPALFLNQEVTVINKLEKERARWVRTRRRCFKADAFVASDGCTPLHTAPSIQTPNPEP